MEIVTWMLENWDTLAALVAAVAGVVGTYKWKHGQVQRVAQEVEAAAVYAAAKAQEAKELALVIKENSSSNKTQHGIAVSRGLNLAAGVLEGILVQDKADQKGKKANA